MTATRQQRLSESRRYLTRLLIIASTIKHDVPPDAIGIEAASQSERDEAADFVKHGSIHIPELLINSCNVGHFAKLVVGWSRLSIATSVVEVVTADQQGGLIIGLPNNRELACVELESELAHQFTLFSRSADPFVF